MQDFENGTELGDGADQRNGNQNESADRPKNGCPKKCMPTLPPVFNNLVGSEIKVESEKPQHLIELLGNLLGVVDYKTNMASFWFLDILALQVLRYKNDLDDHYRSVLISWLAGEMQLIRDKKLSREQFFEEVKQMFSTATETISKGKQLLHWEKFTDGGVVEEITVEKDEEISSDQRSSVVQEAKRRGSKKSSNESLQRRRSKESKIRVDRKNSEDEKKEPPPVFEEIPGSSSSIDPLRALEIVIESTYDVYANELRYALVYAAFVEPIEIQTYHLPFVLRTPRPVKLAASDEAPFGARLQRTLRKNETTEGAKNKLGDKKTKGKAAGSKGKSSNLEVTPVPPPSLTDEETLIEKRKFILPLIEANEASRVFEPSSNDE